MTTHAVNSAVAVDYTSAIAPASYACDCGKSGVKLWRDYGARNGTQKLRCVDCAGKEMGVDLSMMKDDGTHQGQFGTTNQIRWLIPAVPTPADDGFWGYTSIPSDGRDWWVCLPVR